MHFPRARLLGPAGPVEPRALFLAGINQRGSLCSKGKHCVVGPASGSGAWLPPGWAGELVSRASASGWAEGLPSEPTWHPLSLGLAGLARDHTHFQAPSPPSCLRSCFPGAPPAAGPVLAAPAPRPALQADRSLLGAGPGPGPAPRRLASDRSAQDGHGTAHPAARPASRRRGGWPGCLLSSTTPCGLGTALCAHPSPPHPHPRLSLPSILG